MREDTTQPVCHAHLPIDIQLRVSWPVGVVLHSVMSDYQRSSSVRARAGAPCDGSIMNDVRRWRSTFRPSRISGSCRMSKWRNSAPAVRSVCTTCALKPHRGASGDPCACRHARRGLCAPASTSSQDQQTAWDGNGQNMQCTRAAIERLHVLRGTSSAGVT